MQNSIDVIIPIAAGTILLGILIGFIIFFVILYRKKQEEYEWDKEQAKQLLLKTQIEIKEQTLSNISRELHDNLGQVASLIKINLGMVNLENDNENTERVDESLSLIKQMILDIKTISTTLKGENLVRFGLYKMIKKDVDRLTKLGYVNIEINGTDELPEIGHEKEIFLYRMTQEIFNNVLQHSEATKAELLIEDLKNGLKFTFIDNGKGFDSKSVNIGNGLINLQERCKIINAQLEIISSINKGTTTIITLNNL